MLQLVRETSQPTVNLVRLKSNVELVAAMEKVRRAAMDQLLAVAMNRSVGLVKIALLSVVAATTRISFSRPERIQTSHDSTR